MNLLFLIQKNIKKVIFALLALVFLIIIYLLFIYKPPPVNPPLIFTDPNASHPTFDPYLRTTVGQTTDSEIAQFPDIKEIKTREDGGKEYYFYSTGALRDNLIVTKNEVAVFKRVIPTETQNWEHPILSEYLKTYGKPEAEFTGTDSNGPFVKTYVYTSQGFAIVGNPNSDEVYELQSFLPTKVDEYLKLWGDDIRNFKQPEGEQIPL